MKAPWAGYCQRDSFERRIPCLSRAYFKPKKRVMLLKSQQAQHTRELVKRAAKSFD